MKFRLYENIYDGENNNKINKKKYKKHSMSPFVSLNAGDVQRGINMFNHAMGSDTSSTADTSVAMGESIPDEFMMESELNEDVYDNEEYCVISPVYTVCNYRVTVAKISNQMNYIPRYTFRDREYLQKVTIPNSVIRIGWGAFMGCTSLRTINLPNSVEGIDSYAFAHSGLESIKIPDSVKYISNNAFEGCRQLRVIEIPDSVVNLGTHVFSNCPSLKILRTPRGSFAEQRLKDYPDGIDWDNVEIRYTDETNESLNEDAYSNDKIYYLKEFNPLPNANNEYTVAKVSNSIDEVYDEAFDGFYALQKVTIPNNIKTIGRLAFGNCSSLRTINLPNSVKVIKDYAFYESGLESIKIPDSVEYIGVGCFANCEYLRMIEIPASVTEIGNSAFYRCRSLKILRTPQGSVAEDFFQRNISGVEIRYTGQAVNKQAETKDNDPSSLPLEVKEVYDTVKEISDKLRYKSLGTGGISDSIVDTVVVPYLTGKCGFDEVASDILSNDSGKTFFKDFNGHTTEILGKIVLTDDWKNGHAISPKSMIAYYKDGEDTPTLVKISGYDNLGESLTESAKPTYTFRYQGPVYRFERVYTVLKEPIYTTAQNEHQAANSIRGKLKEKFGFDYKAKLDIDEDNVEIVHTPNNEYDDYIRKPKEMEYKYDDDFDMDMVGTVGGKDVYFKDGKYIVDDMEFVSMSEVEDYLGD